MRQNEPSALLIALPIIFMLIIITIVVVAALFLTNILDVGSIVSLQTPTAKPHPTPPNIVITPAALGMTAFRSAALGFELDYPGNWRKREGTLEVVFSPTAEGLAPDNRRSSALWVGIPAGNTLDHGDILRGVLVDFPPPIEVLSQETINLAAESWTSVTFSFGDPASGEQGLGLAAATNKNEVGYFFVAAAPALQWDSMQPVFQQVINSLRFTEETVLRPTDATPPPTPTPTPTPMIYIVRSGDTLLGIALQFDVDVDTLAARNGIEVPEHLQTGQTLIIPVKRK